MLRLITPRPIAWVSTCSADGRLNLAPFSYFNGVGANPPTVVFCPANKRDGTPKDTLLNIEQTGEFVVNVVSAKLTESMHQTSAPYERHVDEFTECGLTPVSSRRVTPPRVAEACAHLECRLMHSMHLGTGPGGANLVIGRIILIHIDDQMLDADGLADPARIDSVGRMGGQSYTRTRDRFDLPPV
jgi:flavin reductase (DIM6/NTAB) family NADH-FMN oxidoreductase RutF